MAAKKRPQRKKLESEKDLTPLQAGFVKWYTTPGETLYNGTRSAKAAGYQGDNQVLAVTAWRLLRTAKVKAAIRHALKEQYEQADLTIASVLAELEEARTLAMSNNDYGAALRATIQKGHYLKMWTEKIEHVHTIDDVSTDDLTEMALRLAKKIPGFDTSLIQASKDTKH
jgi:phage terminase small subunit